MPMVYVTKEEFDALYFLMCEVEGNVEGSDDESYVEDFRKANTQFNNFRKKIS